ncbi:MAG: MarR family transcriptional regulator [Patescibacteria group bacterium]
MANEMDTTVALFLQAGQMMRRNIDAARLPLTPAQYEVLRHVATHEQLSMQGLAHTLRITAPSATGLVSELVESGYLKRTGNTADRRQVLLAVTSSGKRAAALCTTKRTRVLRRVLKGLSARDHRDLQRIFTIMINPNN